MADYIGQNIYITPTRIVSLPEYYGSNSYRSTAQLETETNLKNKNHQGRLSAKAIQKMRTAINWLLCSAETKKVYQKSTNRWFDFKINFITLTLPDTANVIDNKALQKNLLNPFFTYLRTYCNLNNYIWKLEFQKNGKLHVHFIADTFIHHRKLRSIWNKLLQHNGYLIAFHAKFGHSDPNSTDVHSVRKIRNLAAYMAKYMTKQQDALDSVKGRIWGCSQKLSAAFKTKVFIDRDQCHLELKPLFSNNIPFQPMGSIDKLTGRFKQYGEIFYLTYLNWKNDLIGDIKAKFEETCLTIKGIISATPPSFVVD
jgi:hypothetical protein